MKLYTKILRFLLRDLYARNEAERLEIKSVSEQMHQQISELKQQNQNLTQQLNQIQLTFQTVMQNADERDRQAEKRLDCLEHYRSETEKRLQSDDMTTLELAHKIELLQTSFQQNQFQLFNKKTYSQAGEDAILMYACAMLGIPFENCNYLDLGANQPVAMSNTYFFYERGARGVLLEANPLLIPALKNQRSGDIVLNQAVTAKSGETVTFHILNLDGLSKIGDISDILEANPGAKLEQSIQIETICYNDIITRYFDKKAPVILNLDIEGLEMPILQSMNFDLYRPLFIIIEMIPYSKKLTAGIKNQELFHYLNSQNYIEYAFTGINSIFIDKLQYETFTS